MRIDHLSPFLVSWRLLTHIAMDPHYDLRIALHADGACFRGIAAKHAAIPIHNPP